MKNKNAILIPLLLAASLLVGCASNTRNVNFGGGKKSQTSNAAFLETVSGYDDEMTTADGSSYRTTVQNITGDVQMVTALDGLVTHLGQIFLLAQGNTNIVISTPTTASTPRAPPRKLPVSRLIR